MSADPRPARPPPQLPSVDQGAAVLSILRRISVERLGGGPPFPETAEPPATPPPLLRSRRLSTEEVATIQAPGANCWREAVLGFVGIFGRSGNAAAKVAPQKPPMRRVSALNPYQKLETPKPHLPSAVRANTNDSVESTESVEPEKEARYIIFRGKRIFLP
jgi:hypothetical protein